MIFPLTCIVIIVSFVIDMMMLIKYLTFLFVVVSDDYGYAFVEHKGYRDEAESIELVKMEAV